MILLDYMLLVLQSCAHTNLVAMMKQRSLLRSRIIFLICTFFVFFHTMASIVPAITMTEDPDGFRGIAWGANLSSVKGLELKSTWEHLKEYSYTSDNPHLGTAPVDVVKLTTIEDKFARVQIRYQGEKTHKRVLSYLQQTFGTIERIPGSMVRGLNQQFSWRGPHTDINLTYQGMGERGFVYIESRELAPRFTDLLPNSAY